MNKKNSSVILKIRELLIEMGFNELNETNITISQISRTCKCSRDLVYQINRDMQIAALHKERLLCAIEIESIRSKYICDIEELEIKRDKAHRILISKIDNDEDTGETARILNETKEQIGIIEHRNIEFEAHEILNRIDEINEELRILESKHYTRKS